MLGQKTRSNPKNKNRGIRFKQTSPEGGFATKPGERPRSENSRLYRQLTPAYEMVFPLLVKKRISHAIRELELKQNDQVLEVGIGTGVSLGAYPRHIDVTGIDLSEEMLSVARRKIVERGWNHIRVQPGNAEQLDFPDSTFDCVTAFHVISVVSQPRQMMQEIARVVKPGGKVLIINHFRSKNAWIANVIDRADSVTRHLGWRTDLECDSIVQELPFEVVRRYKTSPWSLFTVLKATRTA
jgi:phosphatidylethanolamine/phosphatidyl-N-methylethanolamine N-methyltransferase